MIDDDWKQIIRTRVLGRLCIIERKKSSANKAMHINRYRIIAKGRQQGKMLHLQSRNVLPRGFICFNSRLRLTHKHSVQVVLEEGVRC